MKDIERLIANIQFDVDTGWDFFKAVDFEAGVGIGPGIQHVELGNGVDAITSRCAEGFSCEWWDLETVQTLAREFNMKVVVLKKHDCDSNWNMANDFDEYDCTKGLNVMDYCKDIEDATVLDTIDDVEKAYNEYIDNLEDTYACDQNTLLEESDKARKGRDQLIEQVKHKSPSEFVIMPSDDTDADNFEIMLKFSTMFYDSYNGVNYALGLIPKEG